MFGARKRDDAQTFRTRGGKLDKGRGVKSRKLHSVVDCLSVDSVQGWRGALASSLRIGAGSGRINFVQTRI